MVVVAFDALAKLFEQPIISSRLDREVVMRKSNSHLHSQDNIRKNNSSLNQDKVKFAQLSFDLQEENKHIKRNKFSHSNNQFQNEISTANRTESSKKRTESGTAIQNRLSDESRSKSSTLNDKQQYSVNKTNSLRDSRVDKITKTPNLSKSNKIEELSSIHNYSYTDHINKSAKNKPGIITMKHQGHRNNTINNLPISGVTEKNKEYLSHKFMRKSEDYNKKRTEIGSKSLSKGMHNNLDFGGLSMNSKRKHKNKEFKESVRYL